MEIAPWKKHVIGTKSLSLFSDDSDDRGVVLLIALLAAAYQMQRLEYQRTSRHQSHEQQFEDAVRVVRHRLLVGKYQVVTLTPASIKSNRVALIINRAYAIPHVEAELILPFPSSSSSSSTPKKPAKASSNLRFRVYDEAAMRDVAQV